MLTKSKNTALGKNAKYAAITLSRFFAVCHVTRSSRINVSCIADMPLLLATKATSFGLSSYFAVLALPLVSFSHSG